ncbi:hypothetical protein ILP97_08195 [Amycolatopsis sp. H6(2020)]|nr:hypothetical protein [Amycolatopsis sp. H6(2020)]
MDVNDEWYARVMGELRDRIPGLADQVDREVRYGRSVSEKGLRDEGRYEERATRLAETNLAPLGKKDVAVVPYTDDERIELVRQALLTLAKTMYASRQSVRSELRGLGVRSTVTFAEPEPEPETAAGLSDETVIDMDEQVDSARETLREVQDLLGYSGDVSRGDL